MEREVSMEAMQDQINEIKTEISKVNTTLATHAEQIKSVFKRMDEQAQLTETVHKLATSIELLVAKQEITTEKVTETNRKLEEITHDVDELKQKPAKKWDESVKAIVLGIIAGIVAFLLSKLGIK